MLACDYALLRAPGLGNPNYRPMVRAKPSFNGKIQYSSVFVPNDPNGWITSPRGGATYVDSGLSCTSSSQYGSVMSFNRNDFENNNDFVFLLDVTIVDVASYDPAYFAGGFTGVGGNGLFFVARATETSLNWGIFFSTSLVASAGESAPTGRHIFGWAKKTNRIYFFRDGQYLTSGGAGVATLASIGINASRAAGGNGLSAIYHAALLVNGNYALGLMPLLTKNSSTWWTPA